MKLNQFSKNFYLIVYKNAKGKLVEKTFPNRRTMLASIQAFADSSKGELKSVSKIYNQRLPKDTL